ncbi:recQ-mediated genome instability protein 1-like isoform X2 [Planococcus citri]|uniref:recQ-mediated genome instability protein 1-like isoform X2 n=1 Tax=Planococcus citri TaxID=170843 RepID=UPI0031F85749
MAENQIRDVVRFLNSRHIKISEQNEWLVECYEYFKSNNPQSNRVETQEFVYDQWKLADLRDIAEGSLQPNIANIPATSINEKIILQVDSVLDVAESCYSQLLKIRNVNTSNVEATETKPQDWEPKKKRMLKLTCTDGVQTIYGMEYKLIPSLKEPFYPGFKILVIGPVECRRGTLLLGPQNIQCLGGEVDSIMVENHLENILARKLNVPENPNPFNPTQPPDNMANMNGNNHVDDDNGAQSTNNRSDDVDEFSDNNEDIFLAEHLTQMENLLRMGTLPTTNSAPSASSDSNRGSSTSRQTNSFPLSTSGFQPFSSREPDVSPSTSHGKKVGIAHPIISTNNFSSKRTAPSPIQSDIKLPRVIANEVQENRPRQFQTFNENIGSSSSASVNLKIKDLKRLVNSDCGIRKCNASFLRITSKPKIREEVWHLSGEIKDETGELDVAFSDPLLEKLFEFSAVEILSQKERMKSNPDIKERIDGILRRGVQRLTSLKGQFHIEFSNSFRLPTVTNVIE